jgi:hypothetical protein
MRLVVEAATVVDVATGAVVVALVLVVVVD